MEILLENSVNSTVNYGENRLIIIYTKIGICYNNYIGHKRGDNYEKNIFNATYFTTNI